MTHARHEQRIAVGIDPGRKTGMVALTLPTRLHPHPRWIGSAMIIRKESARLTRAESSASHFRAIRDQLMTFRPALAVIEDPSDLGEWRAAGRFGLGESFGIALGACASLSIPIVTYLVKGKPKLKREGWMPRMVGNSSRIEDRDITLAALRAQAAKTGCLDGLEEDEAMALGVLLFHLTHHHQLA